MLLANYDVQWIFSIAGSRPGGRSTFVSAKVDKAIDAQFGHIGWDGCAEEERANSLRSNKARRIQRASDPRAGW